MKLLRGFQPISDFKLGTVATIGNFDGVHRGHQALLTALRTQANKLQLPMLVVLFEPQPSEYFHGTKAPARLASLREKLNVLQQCGVDYVYCLKFDQRLASMTPTEFATQILFSFLHIKYLLIGQDFRFGSNRLGDVNLLQKIASQKNYRVEIFSDFYFAQERVSSTKIRAALHQNKLVHAAELLGRSFSLCGRVMQGDGRGRQWSIPTANLSLHRITLPMTGVFCVQIQRAQSKSLLLGVANLGTRPTVDGTKRILEIHLFDFNESIYGEFLQIFFIHKLREELRFSSVDTLIAQIHADIGAAKHYFLNNVIPN